MNYKQILTTARGFIDAGWTRGSFARDSKGNRVDVMSPNACSFCSLGAIMKANNMDVPYSMHRHVSPFIPHGMGIGEWNDAHGRTKEEVLTLFDKAIEACDGTEVKTNWFKYRQLGNGCTEEWTWEYDPSACKMDKPGEESEVLEHILDNYESWMRGMERISFEWESHQVPTKEVLEMKFIQAARRVNAATKFQTLMEEEFRKYCD